jgi:WD40 repeat protein
MLPESTPSAQVPAPTAPTPSPPHRAVPPMSCEQVLAGKVFADAQGLEVGQLVSFHILEKVAEGGMGIVYRAQQDYPRRTVALKVIKAAAASPQTLRRFQREVAILAQLQDPAIAQLYSVGEVDTGISGALPFLAMEFVEGLPITNYAAAHKLDIRGKLELMARVCEGVAYAQRCGVIHRDLKPANVLVTRAGQPKILDFGLATLRDAHHPDDATLTEPGQLLGTLEYMSPEQARGQPQAIDQRTDVYALGVMLFELLTGQRPVDLSNCTLVEALEHIQTTPPTRLASTSRVFRGDVDVLVNKAMAKDQAQRYASAHDLADDLRRLLRQEPIRAHRPTLAYRVGKYVQRNKVLVISSSAIVLALALGLVATARESHRANREAANARTQAARAAAEAHQARLQLAQATMASGDAFLAMDKFDAARSAFNTAWEVLADMHQPTRHVALAMWELDYRSGRPIRVLEKDHQTVRFAAFSSDQRLLALGYDSGIVQVRQVWNDQIRIETRLGSNAHFAVFSPSNKYFLLGNAEICELWDLENRRKLGSRPLGGTGQMLAALNDDVAAVCDEKGRLYCSPVAQFLQVGPQSLPVRNLQSLRLVGKDAYMVADQSRILRLSEEHIEVLGSRSWSDFRQVDLSPDGQGVLAIGKETLVARLPELKPAPMAGYEGASGGGWINASLLWLLNPNGKTIDYVGLDGSVVAQVPFVKPADTLACADQFLIAPNAQRQTILRAVHVPTAWRVLAPAGGQPVTGTLSQDGRIAAVALKDGRVCLLDTQGGRPLGELTLGAPARFLKFDSQTLRIVALTTENTLQLWKVPQLTREWHVKLDGSVRAWDLAPSGNTCCFSRDGEAGAWAMNLDSPTAQPLRLPVSFPVSGIAPASSDDRWLLVGSEGGELWNTAGQPQKVAALNMGSAGIVRVAFLQQPSWLVTESTAKTLQLWHSSPKGFKEQPLHNIPQAYLSWSLAGSSLVVRQNDALTFVDPVTDQVERRMVWSRDLGRPLAFSADGRCLLALATAGVVAINWAVPEDLRAFEASPNELSQARWFSAAGLPAILDRYPQFADGPSACLTDAYGLWACGAPGKGQEIFAHTGTLTPGAVALLKQAAGTPAGTKH